MRAETVRQRLLTRRQQLLARYRDELERANEEVEVPEPELIDQATEQWQARVLSLLGAADGRAVEAVTEALRRLERGAYGVCVDCGGRIARARLHALPEAATCIGCATAAARAA